ncbi:uncharacterized protein LOC143421460 [Maylandia zebra]|uniref:uncharacterized protein LOC143421460 n=1 Tax=Maylandia zebra TaxID=106582 RepID=UPI00403D2AF9
MTQKLEYNKNKYREEWEKENTWLGTCTITPIKRTALCAGALFPMDASSGGHMKNMRGVKARGTLNHFFVHQATAEADMGEELGPVSLASEDTDNDNREIPHPCPFGKYRRSLETLIPFRCSSPESHAVDNAGLISSSVFLWMIPKMWAMFKNGLDTSDLHLSPSDVADISAKRG